MGDTLTIDDIIKEAKAYLPDLNEKRVRAAFEYAEKAHAGQTRACGKPYISHPVEVTGILLSLKPDEDSIIAALLHDVVEDTAFTIEELEKEFGAEMVPLLKGLEKLSNVNYQGRERQIENLRKMFLAMAQDIRVVLIKLADRLHNMRTLDALRPDKQKRIAEETLSIYAPIASRLGIYTIKNELETLCIRTLYPDSYQRIEEELEELTSVQNDIVNVSKQSLLTILKEHGIDADIKGRVKNPYSIYKKLKKKDRNYVSELYDVFAVRLIVENEAQCYQTLGLLHKNWTPLSRRFKDYIGHPKPNGYQSLHTTLIGLVPKLRNQPIEVQIRTHDMNRVAEFGIAAHWHYKENGTSHLQEQKLAWVQSLVELHETLQGNNEFIESLNVDIFHDRIFVLTPKGDVLDLPYDATPVDFAYAIHSDIGHRCKGAKVSGQIVPLDHKLRNGQVVEILTTNIDQPNRYWLSFVVTSNAKSKIKSWFNSQDEDQLIRIGKELINKKLKQFNRAPLDPNLGLLKNYGGEKLSVKEREELVKNVANGSTEALDLIRAVLPDEQFMKKTNKDRMAKEVLSESISYEDLPEVLITGEKGYKTQMASCCAPQPNEPIIGYITRGRGVTIHRKTCKVLNGLQKDRLIKTNWSTEKIPEYTVKLKIERRSRIGLLRDIADIFARNKLPILDIENIRESGTDQGRMLITANLDSMDTLDRIMQQIEQTEGVFSVSEID